MSGEFIVCDHVIEIILELVQIEEAIGGDRQIVDCIGNVDFACALRRERQHGARGAPDGAAHV